MTLFLSTGWHHHGWFLLWPLIPLFWIGVLILFARFVVWRVGPGPLGRRYAGPDAHTILAERYARGEIGLDEYRVRRANLDS
jgi:putative membrane protein